MNLLLFYPNPPLSVVLPSIHRNFILEHKFHSCQQQYVRVCKPQKLKITYFSRMALVLVFGANH